MTINKLPTATPSIIQLCNANNASGPHGAWGLVATLFCLIAGSSSADCWLHDLSAYLLTHSSALASLLHLLAVSTCVPPLLHTHTSAGLDAHRGCCATAAGTRQQQQQQSVARVAQGQTQRRIRAGGACGGPVKSLFVVKDLDSLSGFRGRGFRCGANHPTIPVQQLDSASGDDAPLMGALQRL